VCAANYLVFACVRVSYIVLVRGCKCRLHTHTQHAPMRETGRDMTVSDIYTRIHNIYTRIHNIYTRIHNIYTRIHKMHPRIHRIHQLPACGPAEAMCRHHRTHMHTLALSLFHTHTRRCGHGTSGAHSMVMTSRSEHTHTHTLTHSLSLSLSHTHKSSLSPTFSPPPPNPHTRAGVRRQTVGWQRHLRRSFRSTLTAAHEVCTVYIQGVCERECV